MSHLVDTMVLSELAKAEPDHRVIRWFTSRAERSLFVSVLTVGEIAKGIEGLAEGKRRRELESWLAHELRPRFEGRILPVDSDVAELWGRLSAERRAAGHPLPVIDGLLAATARHHRLTLVTRNMKDFENLGVVLEDPWH